MRSSSWSLAHDSVTRRKVSGTKTRKFPPPLRRDSIHAHQPKMADADGLLLNFSIGDDPLRAKTIFKGGNWRHRLKANKGLRNRGQKGPKTREQQGPVPPGVESTVTNLHESDTGSLKRQRLDADDGTHPRSPKPSKPSRKSTLKDGEIVSSLFTYNPTSAVPAQTTHDAGPVEPSNAPLPEGLSNFTSLGLSAPLARHLLNKLELKNPTAIQRVVVPQLIREDADAFIQAETGSGKTLAYLLPIVERIMASAGGSHGGSKIHRDSGLFAVILAPTRELCRQISVVLESLLRCAHWIVAGTIMGGEKKKSEKARLRKGLNVLIATPGRLADHLDNTKVLDVRNVRWLVLDEGDRLMELGFEAEIQGIVKTIEERSNVGKTREPAGLPRNRVTVLCSATMKMNVQKLGEISLKEAVHLTAETSTRIEDGDEPLEAKDSFSAPAQLVQAYATVPAKLRLVTLTAILKRALARRGSVMKAIVFMSCADSVDFHFSLFARPENESTKEGETPQDAPTHPTSASSTTLSSLHNTVMLHKLHGSLAQQLRTSTLKAFTVCSDPSILICTDVASRGLDLPNIDLVLEYDPPFSASDHLHRIGRTARAGNGGRAVILLTPGPEEGYVSILQDAYRDGGRGLVRHDANDLLRKGFGSTGLGAGGDWETNATEWQLDIERWVVEDPRMTEMARRAFQSHIRAYATHVAAERGIFNIADLHLGHWAKAFALRERPGGMGVPGARKSANAGKETRRHVTERESDAAGTTESSGRDAARKMRTKMTEQMAGISEFNIG
jgi:ATP-dependent RNA helicase DDX31/DBP7